MRHAQCHGGRTKGWQLLQSLGLFHIVLCSQILLDVKPSGSVFVHGMHVCTNMCVTGNNLRCQLWPFTFFETRFLFRLFSPVQTNHAGDQKVLGCLLSPSLISPQRHWDETLMQTLVLYLPTDPNFSPLFLQTTSEVLKPAGKVVQWLETLANCSTRGLEFHSQ